MKKVLIASILILFGTSLTYADQPCKPLADACSSAGYYRGGNTVGKGLIMDCMVPVLSNKMKMNVNMSAADKKACKTELEEKIREYKQQNG